MSDHGKQNLQGALTALAAMGIFATHDVAVKMLGSHYSAVQVVFFAALFSFPILALLVLRDPAGGSLWPRNPGWVFLRTATSVITTVAAFHAFGVLPLAQTYAILFAIPLIITLLSIPILGEKVRFRRWIAVIVGLLGVLIVLRPGHAALSTGHLSALVAAITGSLTAIIVRKVGDSERPVVLLIYPIFGNFLIMCLVLPFFYRPMPGADLGLVGIIAVLGPIASLLSIRSFQKAEAVIVAPMQYSQILWAIFYGLIFFQETPDLATLIGATIVIMSGIYIVLREARSGASANRPVLETGGRSDIVAPTRPGLRQRFRQSSLRSED